MGYPTPASAEEIEAKLQPEAADDITDGEPLTGVVERISSEIPEIRASAEKTSQVRATSISPALKFERLVMEALIESDLFDDIQGETAISARSAPNTPITVLDAIGYAGSHSYVLEFKHRVRKWTEVENQIRLGITALLNTPEMKRRLLVKPVRGIIVTADLKQRRDWLSSDIAVLYFDEHARTFTNLDVIRKWIHGL